MSHSCSDFLSCIIVSARSAKPDFPHNVHNVEIITFSHYMTESQCGSIALLLLFVQYESNLEGHAAPGGEKVPTQAPRRRRLED